MWNILEIMNYTTAGTVPFAIKLKQDTKSSESCRSSFSNQSTKSSNSSKSVSSFSSATNYSCQISNKNNSSSKLHKSPRCFDDLNQLSKWVICIIIVYHEKYIKTANNTNQSKEWELEKETKVNSEFLLIKSSGIISIFLPAFYLIIWPMTHQRNF